MLATVTTAALLAGGCSAGGTPPGQDTTPAALPCDRDATAAPGARVTVLSAGAAPRAPLRYRPRAGSTTRVTVRQSMTATARAAGGTAATATLTSTVRSSTGVRAVCGRVFTTATEYTRPEVSTLGPNLETLRDRLALLDGLVVRESRDDRGELIAASRSAEAGADPVAQQTLDDLLAQLTQSVVFPEQPLGIGGRWRYQRTERISGLTVTSTTEYTLTARDDDGVSLTVRLAGSAPRQTFRATGRDVLVESYQGTGQGTLRVDVRSAVASSANITTTARQRLRTSGTPVDQRVAEVVSLSTR